MICLIIRHSAAARDIQDAVRGQYPDRILTAGTGGDHGRLRNSRHIGHAILFGIALSVGVCRHRQRHTLGCILEDVPANFDRTIRDVQALQVRVALEHIFTHTGQLAVLADLHTGELGAIVEGIAIDSCNGIRDGNGRQIAVTKGTPADPFQFAAILKGHAFQFAAPVETELADIGNILADDDLLDFTVVLTDRGHVTEFIVIHGSGASDRKSAVAIENVVNRLTAQTCIDNIRCCAADKTAAFKFTLFAIELICALIGKRILIK